MKLSIVIPVYKADKILPILLSRIEEVLVAVLDEYEIIFVNDGSPDNAWEVIRDMVATNKNVIGVNLTRNFGQHYAITAGLEQSTCEWVVVMDCDLQDDPKEILNFLIKKDEGYDVVFGRRVIRKDKFIKGYFSKYFYKLFDHLTDNTSDNTVSNFGIYSRQTIDHYLALKEKIRLFPFMVKWLGFKTGYIDVEHSSRLSGRSSYSYYRLINLAFDAIISQTNKPLRISIKLGFTMSAASFLYLMYLVLQKLLFNVSMGWTSIMVSVFFVGGLLFANLGLIGIYIGKIYDEVKNRPLYVIKETIGQSKTN